MVFIMSKYNFVLLNLDGMKYSDQFAPS